MGATTPSLLTGSARAEWEVRQVLAKHLSATELASFDRDLVALKAQYVPPLIEKRTPKGLGILSTQYVVTWVPAPMPTEGPGSDAYLAQAIKGLGCKYLRPHGLCQDDWADVLVKTLASVAVGVISAGVGSAVGSAVGGGSFGETVGSKLGDFGNAAGQSLVLEPPRPPPPLPRVNTQPIIEAPKEDAWLIPAVVVLVVAVVLVAKG